MLDLSFPNYEFRLKEINQKRFIFDEIRKKYIELTAEEWVRQNCIKFLINEKKFKRIQNIPNVNNSRNSKSSK